MASAGVGTATAVIGAEAIGGVVVGVVRGAVAAETVVFLSPARRFTTVAITVGTGVAITVGTGVVINVGLVGFAGVARTTVAREVLGFCCFAAAIGCRRIDVGGVSRESVDRGVRTTVTVEAKTVVARTVGAEIVDAAIVGVAIAGVGIVGVGIVDAIDLR